MAVMIDLKNKHKRCQMSDLFKHSILFIFLFCILEDCYSVASEYEGTTSVTAFGLQCQSWSTYSPHNHTYRDNKQFPDASIEEAGNHCRAPDGDVRPWCYTVDPNERWQFCNVSECSGALFIYIFVFVQMI